MCFFFSFIRSCCGVRLHRIFFHSIVVVFLVKLWEGELVRLHIENSPHNIMKKKKRRLKKEFFFFLTINILLASYIFFPLCAFFFLCMYTTLSLPKFTWAIWMLSKIKIYASWMGRVCAFPNDGNESDDTNRQRRQHDFTVCKLILTLTKEIWCRECEAYYKCILNIYSTNANRIDPK